MAKALFHKSQRVFVKPVGTWALIEKVVPHWVKDVDEPLRVTYECGLGRSFQSHELAAEESLARDSHVLRPDDDDSLLEHWHIARRRAKWRASIGGLGISDVGTYPVVVTDEDDQGGWRVTGGEYDRDPQRIEHQARMIACTPDLLQTVRQIADFCQEKPDDCPSELKQVAQRCASILRFVYQLDDATEADSATVAAE
ncbi:hypothetical protein [Hyphomonas sp.]|jgi:hypothetical protein|uniref:hypothetical protein n=1 Tax=Hyphomonas sp. TaxID=87 RepID=UPI0026131809|nr:hypothetical protein [Hyphomonas sp.]MDF1805546.1 hypothetical protein [Hyphomonas sp.]|tara:strand:+ start:398 stop:991 length:594 start_codon:yes stop_codon:yes gene_type:complete